MHRVVGSLQIAAEIGLEGGLCRSSRGEVPGASGLNRPSAELAEVNVHPALDDVMPEPSDQTSDDGLGLETVLVNLVEIRGSSGLIRANPAPSGAELLGADRRQLGDVPWL